MGRKDAWEDTRRNNDSKSQIFGKYVGVVPGGLVGPRAAGSKMGNPALVAALPTWKYCQLQLLYPWCKRLLGF